MKKGFTLIELLSVIIILGVILAIAVPRTLSIIEESKRSSFESSVKLLSKNIKLFATDDLDLTTITIDNMEEHLGVSNSNFTYLNIVYDDDNNPSFMVVGNEKFNNLIGIHDETQTVILEELTYEFEYVGETEEFIIPYTANYEIQVFGAQGGGRPSDPDWGGKGAHVKAEKTFNKNDVLYITVGGKGGNSPTNNIDGSPNPNTNGGFNGGGHGSGTRGPGGGGSSDVRFGGNTISDRIIVASGGGGNGLSGSYSVDPSSTPNSNGILFQGTNGASGYSGSYPKDTAGGGGGYYGGLSIDGDDPSRAYSGTNYIDSSFVEIINLNNVRSDNGHIKITITFN